MIPLEDHNIMSGLYCSNEFGMHFTYHISFYKEKLPNLTLFLVLKLYMETMKTSTYEGQEGGIPNLSVKGCDGSEREFNHRSVDTFGWVNDSNPGYKSYYTQQWLVRNYDFRNRAA